MSNEVELGKVFVSEKVMNLIDGNIRFERFVSSTLTRFVMKDWGDTIDDDWETNDNFAKKKGGRILAVYNLPTALAAISEESIWVLLDKDKKTTKVMFPDEYRID